MNIAEKITITPRPWAQETIVHQAIDSWKLSIHYHAPRFQKADQS